MYVCMKVCMCIYVLYIYVCMYAGIYTCIYCMYLWKFQHVKICMYVYDCIYSTCTDMNVCIVHTRVYACMKVCMYVCMYVCICLYVCMYTLLKVGHVCMYVCKCMYDCSIYTRMYTLMTEVCININICINMIYV